MNPTSKSNYNFGSNNLNSNSSLTNLNNSNNNIPNVIVKTN